MTEPWISLQQIGQGETVGERKTVHSTAFQLVTLQSVTLLQHVICLWIILSLAQFRAEAQTTILSVSLRQNSRSSYIAMNCASSTRDLSLNRFIACTVKS